MSSELDELGDSSLRELYEQEKKLTSLMKIELNKLKDEIAQYERSFEINEESQTNSIQNKLIKYKSNNQALSSQIKHQRNVTKLLKSNYKSLQEQISQTRAEIDKYTEMALESKTNDNDIDIFIESVKVSMERGELNDDLINQKLVQINKKLTEAEKVLDDSIQSVTSTTQTLNKDNFDLGMSIQIVEEDIGASFRRRRTSTGHVVSLLTSPERSRRHTDSKSPLRRNRLGSK